MELNITKTKTTSQDYNNSETLGIIIIIRDIKPNGSLGEEKEEFISVEAIDRFRAKHNLDRTKPYKNIGKEVTDYWNKTIRSGENKRKFIKVYEKLKGIYYI